ncbi:MAG: M48 family metallopeptidase [Bacteroidetes bacterium]|nr:M48 family metallopeptidase [Bacteroidota bacterium]
MTSKFFAALAFWCIAIVHTQAQNTFQPAFEVDFNNYQPLKCSGKIPDDILKSTREKYNSDLKAENKRSGSAYRDVQKEQFLLQSNYVLDNLLTSGKVLFGDSVTTYINQLADVLLADDQQLRSKLRFYCLRISDANAFSTDQGMIFVTIGLIAQLENEAQLAFILSHEIAHYEKRHTLNQYLENKKIFSRTARDYYRNYDERIRSSSEYSKDQEIQADSLGLHRLRNVGYDCEQALTSLFVLQYSYLPFEDIPFNKASLNTPLAALPQALFLDSIKPINFESDNEDDTYNSHPNMLKRRLKLEGIIDNSCNASGKVFLISESRFLTCRKICRYETIMYDLTSRNYIAVFYNAAVLMQENPGSTFLKVSQAKALYGLAKYKNHEKSDEVIPYYKKIEGEQQQAYHMFYKLSASQLNMMAMRFIFNYQQQIPESNVLKEMLNDLAEEAYYYHDIDYSTLKENYRIYQEAKLDSARRIQDSINALNAPKTVDTLVKAAEQEQKYVSKYDKLRAEKKKVEEKVVVSEKQTIRSKFHLLAFADILEQKEVKALFENAEARASERKEAEKKEELALSKMSAYEKRKAKEKAENYTGQSLGLKKVLVIDPFYFAADERKGLHLLESDDKKRQLTQQIIENARYANLEVELFDPKTFTADDVDKYNDLAMLNDWISERMQHDEIEILPASGEMADQVARKHNAEDIYIAGVFSYKQPRSNRGSILLVCLFLYPALPFAIVYALTPEQDTYFFSLVYNLHYGTQRMKRVIHMKSKSRNGYINSQMYDLMLQIKRSPGQKK